MTRVSSAGALAAAAIALGASSAALAHHGFGRFDLTQEVTFSGTLTRVDFVNPHTYMYFDTTDASGAPLSVKCELRAATLLRRSGWDADMFEVGADVALRGFAHREDPSSCYVEDLQIGDVSLSRNDQLSDGGPAETGRALRTPWGAPNLDGDWAVELGVLTVPPEGGSGAIVPKSVSAQYASGELTLEEIRAAQDNLRPTAVFSEAGQAAADAFVMWAPEDNPRLQCKPTSILFDWTFDWPVNRITQSEDQIVIDYGIIATKRTIHLGMDDHPADLEPSNAGHSIGWWDGGTLVVDTIGFEPGVLSPPIRSSGLLHVIERFTLAPDGMSIKRAYTAIDPVTLAAPYVGSDTVLVADVPWEPVPCEELTPEFSDDAIAAATAAARAEEAAAAQD